jgi:hypothetical protein
MQNILVVGLISKTGILNVARERKEFEKEVEKHELLRYLILLLSVI